MQLFKITFKLFNKKINKLNMFIINNLSHAKYVLLIDGNVVGELFDVII